MTSSEQLTDGGDVENYGLIPLLARGVRAIVVCINTVWPLSLEYDPATWPDSDADPGTIGAPRVIDPFLAPLFGEPSTRFPNNRVFAEGDYAAVVTALQTAKRAGRTVMTVHTHTVARTRGGGSTAAGTSASAGCTTSRWPSGRHSSNLRCVR